MSRQGLSHGRHLTLTEELERLEQSITLTLQEIDHNFSRAHRIVTSSILPIVERYAEHSQQVWEGSKFWKQFFEASANVSLSGYEEAMPDEDDTVTATSIQDSTTDAPLSKSASHTTPTSPQPVEDSLLSDDSSLLIDSPSNATVTHSTPASVTGDRRSLKTASRPDTSNRLPERARHRAEAPSTPLGQKSTQADLFSSPFAQPSALKSGTVQRQRQDPLLHRVLDKTYRVQATPRTTHGKTVHAATAEPSTHLTRQMNLDSSPASSPAMAPPQLRSDMFSPAPRSAQKLQLPRTPGVPLRSIAAPNSLIGRAVGSPGTGTAAAQRTPALWDSDDDDTGELDVSPPKTIQFSIPTRLVATPAREASRRIVADLLREAGAEEEGDSEDLGPPSPTLVKGIEDDTF